MNRFLDVRKLKFRNEEVHDWTHTFESNVPVSKTVFFERLVKMRQRPTSIYAVCYDSSGDKWATHSTQVLYRMFMNHDPRTNR